MNLFYVVIFTIILALCEHSNNVNASYLKRFEKFGNEISRGRRKRRTPRPTYKIYSRPTRNPTPLPTKTTTTTSSPTPQIINNSGSTPPSTPRPTRKIYSPGVRDRPTRNPTPLPTIPQYPSPHPTTKPTPKVSYLKHTLIQ